ncbi:MAG: putative pyridoxal kinase [Peltula sp. TS41687]|nr:MAG: putative pyridoxal kinase [Peltula sp. TS41687]
MATFVMQSLGCEVAALNTVQYSNHVGYGTFKGSTTSAEEIRDLYEGLSQNRLDDFDMMLSGYIPSAEAVAAVGSVARDLKLKSSNKPGGFFWVLDPVMGDEDRLYVDERVVPEYKHLIRDADLILPNQFEAEVLTNTTISTLSEAVRAIGLLHQTYHVPHIIITSVKLAASSSSLNQCLIGSSARSDGRPRVFRIEYPMLDCHFVGTGDMFAGLIVVRLREAVLASPARVSATRSWVSPDDVRPAELPLARAAEKVIASMQAVLMKTKEARDEELVALGKESADEKRIRLRRTKAAEVRLVRNVEDLKRPVVECRAEGVLEVD